MTTTRPPGLPSYLMDDESKIPAEHLTLLAELSHAFGGSAEQLLEEARAVTPGMVDEYREYEGLHVEDPELRQRLEGPALRLAAEAPEVLRFDVDSVERAEWAMRKLREVKGRSADNVALAQQWKGEVDAWLERVNGPQVRQASYLEGLLIGFLRRQRATDPRVKSIPLTGGKIASNGGTALKPAISDPAEVLKWAKALPERIRTSDLYPVKVTEEVQISRLAKILEVREVITPRKDGDEETSSVDRFAVLAVDPETGAPWADDAEPPRVPGVVVNLPTISYRVELAK